VIVTQREGASETPLDESGERQTDTTSDGFTGRATRRRFLQTTGVVAAGLTMGTGTAAATTDFTGCRGECHGA